MTLEKRWWAVFSHQTRRGLSFRYPGLSLYFDLHLLAGEVAFERRSGYDVPYFCKWFSLLGDRGETSRRQVDSRLLATVLVSYNSRNRVVRDREGDIHLFWGALSIRMTQGEFLDFFGLVTDAAGRAARCGELATCPCGRAVRCPMGQIMLSHGSLTLWFSPEEFEEFYRLVATARQQLADAAPLPPLGAPWTPSHQGFASLN